MAAIALAAKRSSNIGTLSVTLIDVGAAALRCHGNGYGYGYGCGLMIPEH